MREKRKERAQKRDSEKYGENERESKTDREREKEADCTSLRALSCLFLQKQTSRSRPNNTSVIHTFIRLWLDISPSLLSVTINMNRVLGCHSVSVFQPECTWVPQINYRVNKRFVSSSRAILDQFILI